MTPAPFQSLADRFALIIGALRQAVAARGADKRAPLSGVASGAALILLWTRLGRMAARFAALAARVGAGVPAATRPASRRAAPRRPSPPSPRLPRGFGWLLRVTPVAACYASQLRHLLAEPDLSPLLAAEPAFGRVLRPLCRMLGIEMSSIEMPGIAPSSSPTQPKAAARQTAPRAPTKPPPVLPRLEIGVHRAPPRLRSILRA